MKQSRDIIGNVIKDVNYSSKDQKGNEYVMNAKKVQIDFQ